MTNNIKNIMIVMVMAAFCAVANAQAQTAETKVDTTEVNGIELQAIFAQGPDRGCWHPEINNGVATKHLCNGWRLEAGPKVEFLNASSELGKKTTTAIGLEVSGGYKYGIIEPTASFFYGFNKSEVEGQKFNVWEGSFSLRIWSTKHDHKNNLRFFVAPKVSVRNMKSIDYIDLGSEWELFENPCYAPYVALGGEVGIMVNLGKVIKHRSTTVGKNKYFLDIVGHTTLSLTAGLDYGQINKMRDYKTEKSLKLTTGYISLKVGIDLP
jgi:hypothetical protein